LTSTTIAWLAIAVSLLLAFGFLTYKIVINLKQRNWQSVFWGSWLFDAEQLNPEGKQYRRLYLALILISVVLLGFFLAL
jgi:hypothetical protein